MKKKLKMFKIVNTQWSYYEKKSSELQNYEHMPLHVNCTWISFVNSFVPI